MNLGSKIDVDPLSEARLSKIKEGIFDRLDDQELTELMAKAPGKASHSRRGWGVRLGLAMVAAAALVVVGVAHWWPLERLEVADSPSRIVTGASESHLVLGDSSVDVSPTSALLVSGDDARGVLLVLERGRVTCEVAPRRGRPPFVVQAGGVRVRVIGTRFTVTRIDDGARVDVVHGTVEVSALGETSLVRDGEKWESPQRAPTAPAIAPGSEANPAGPTTASGSALAPVKHPNPSRAQAARGAASTRVSSEPTLQGPSEAAASAPTPTAASAEASEPVAGATSESDPTVQQRFERAAEIEKRDPLGAVAMYRDLAAGSGPWAANALFAQGRLEGDRGNVSEGRRLLTAYLSRYPRGRNAADARALLERWK